MKDKIFGVLQRVGRSFMLPIALLPVAGLLLGIGSSFTNETMLAAYGLNSVIHPGTLIYTIVAYHGCLDVGCTITYIGYRELNLGTIHSGKPSTPVFP